MASGKKRKAPAPVRTSTPSDKIRLPDSPGQRTSSPASGSAPGSSPGSSSEDKLLAEEKYYRLKTRAVEDLVTASEENSPPVSRQELRKYTSGPRIRLADWVKALLIKAWMNGIVCYFFIWGLSAYAMNQIDFLFILSVALGLVTNLITNNILRFIAKTPGAYDRWIMVTPKSVLFLPLDVIYAGILVFCVTMTYNTINLIGARISGVPGAITLGVEPILFGIFTLLWDLLFIGVKRLLRRIIGDAKKNAPSAPRS